MNHSYFPWSKMTKQFQNSLNQLPLLVCISIQTIQRSFTQDDLLYQHKLPSKLQLQLRSNFILIYSTSEAIVLDAFEAQPSVFVLIKQISQPTKSYSSSDQKKIQSAQSLIKFGAKTLQKCFISLYCQTTQQNLIELDRKITKTFIINLDFHNQFKPIRRIGQGLTSTVYQALKLINNSQVAVKAFKKSLYFGVSAGKGQKAFLKEFKMLSECCHQNICSFGGVFQTENTIYIVEELYEKSLTSFLCASGQIKRDDVINIMQELLSGISYLHSKGIIHRDLKPENIMFRKQIKNNTYKSVIIDLGLAEYIQNEDYLFQKCGTPGYIAPEVFKKGAKTTKCDIFSLGIIFYNLLYKLPVFEGNNKEQILNKNRLGQMDLKKQKLDKKQEEMTKDLLLKMLDLDQQKRISAENALMHPLLSNRKVPQTPRTKVSLQDSNQIKNQLKFYGTRQIQE